MKTALTGIVAALLVVFLDLGAESKSLIPFYAFDNGVGRGKWTPQEQAAVLKELGYDGISYNYTNNKDLEEWLQAFRIAGLKIFGLYFGTSLDKTPQYDPNLREAVRLLKGCGTVLWMTIMQPAEKGDHDAAAVKIAQEIADLAQENGVRVALYPHAGFYVATALDSVRIVRKAEHPNLGATINLCHEFLSKNEAQISHTIRDVAPYASMISINGVDAKNQQYILRLDQGDYNVTDFLKAVRAAGYKGSVGLQCYGVPGDQKQNLKINLAVWRKIAAQLE